MNKKTLPASWLTNAGAESHALVNVSSGIHAVDNTAYHQHRRHDLHVKCDRVKPGVSLENTDFQGHTKAVQVDDEPAEKYTVVDLLRTPNMRLKTLNMWFNW